MANEFETSGLVPDVLDTAPSDVLRASYGSGLDVASGNELTPAQVWNPPVSLHWPHQADALYTVCMVDPDAPSRRSPSYRSWLHWLVVNVPGEDVTAGDVVTNYQGAQPPSGTGPHRYALVVFRQPGPIEPAATNLEGAPRGGFDLRTFARSHGLATAVAGSHFVSRTP
ncbi:YbhB/YbcL family Raf kinase inhibitor-like protein [Yinghuangia seranimata]|uniref:YbhB/YbcL family Raf kinase inhibitor-like protein n=1 Tax=Yinghuangia seranimata TaxID=408067 RepID=UPI00248A92F6|nr:YbhB/YbcL family Raf kinase inhibitor-like protein [Yinghuangia seranimata]MDI2131305.1 YbhB/YbcL family Raf kinase inhibitor-like protein [Yinghuangia seranimata]